MARIAKLAIPVAAAGLAMAANKAIKNREAGEATPLARMKTAIKARKQ